MREQSIGEYLWFGSVLRFLQDASTDYKIHGPGRTLANIDSFIGGLDGLGLTVTSNAVYQAGLPALRDEFEALDKDAKLTLEQARKLTEMVSSIRRTLDAEAAGKKAFVTGPKRWDVDRLLTDPGSLFGAGVYDQLDQLAAFDFREACKCIAFERSTAGAFHLMRGTEAVLRTFYCHVIRQNRLPKDKRMWAAMVDRLRGRSKPPPKALLDNLDAIRHNYRNPTQHPDEIYSVDGVQDLFGLVIPAVNQMVGIMGD